MRQGCGNPGFGMRWPQAERPIYQELCLGVLCWRCRTCAIPETSLFAMTLSVAEITEDACPLRGLLPLWVGIGVYALFLLAGNRLLIDPDTMWQITVGQWILDHHAVPHTDVYSFTMRGQPWISTQWLAQVLYAKAYAVAGWSGPVVLAAGAIAATFALLDEVSQPASDRKQDAGVRGRGAGADRAASAGAAACAGDAGHGGVDRRPDRRCRPPRRAVVLAAAADGAVGQPAWRLCVRPRADRRRSRSMPCRAPRPRRDRRWRCAGRRSAVAALVAGCCTPYGWNSLLASRKSSPSAARCR